MTTTPTPSVLDLSGDPRAPAPLRFDGNAAHTLPTGRGGFPTLALYGRAAWLSHASGVTVYDLATGRDVADLATQHPPVYDLPRPGDLSKKQLTMIRGRIAFPALAEIGGEPAMLTVVPVKLARRQAGFEMIAARTDDGKLLWRLPVDIYGEPAGKLGSFHLSAAEGVASVTWSEDGKVTGSFAVSLEEPRVLWQRRNFWAIGRSGDALAGFRHETDRDYALTGIGARDGRDLWVKAIPGGATWEIRSNGGPLVQLVDDSAQARLVDVATGDVMLPKGNGLTKRMTCDHGDGGTVLLCASRQDGAFALDYAGKILWRRSAGDGPENWQATVVAEFKDLFYVKGDDGPFVVDGRTGRTVSAGAGVVPDRVNAYAALVYTDRGAEIHPATS
ncbi:hypothetical protein [Nonomuraea typhae]|uniref:hypothetical protein n=1 Tax=Nonomuraea typhae TaxID=2603600 RepID=UPI0012F9BACB|nr:hypothetical protein [Nonomuraea typhae]